VLRVREFLGLSQTLARLAGVSQGAVSRLENGRGWRRRPGGDEICNALRHALASVTGAALT
jgi:transcriptional regulator with XRE-family HTH domain